MTGSENESRPGGELKMQGSKETTRKSLAERSKYQFEADSEDDEMEAEIEPHLDALHGTARRLSLLGRATGEEIEAQNKRLDRITAKVRKTIDLIFCSIAS